MVSIRSKPSSAVTDRRGVRHSVQHDDANPFYRPLRVGQTGGVRPRWPCATAPSSSAICDLTDTIDATRAVAGVRGTAAGWDYDGNLRTRPARPGKCSMAALPHHDDATGPGIVLCCPALCWAPTGCRCGSIRSAATRRIVGGRRRPALAGLQDQHQPDGHPGKASKRDDARGGGLSTRSAPNCATNIQLDSKRCAGHRHISLAAASAVRHRPATSRASRRAGRPGEEGAELAPRFADSYAATTNPLGPQPAIDSLNTLASSWATDGTCRSPGSPPSPPAAHRRSAGRRAAGARWQAMPGAAARHVQHGLPRSPLLTCTARCS
jgi:hypothetical protein